MNEQIPCRLKFKEYLSAVLFDDFLRKKKIEKGRNFS
jgi:hypothetical protein